MSGWRSWATAALLLAGSTAGPALAVDESDLLPVDQAFALQATATAAERIELRFIIADGYYLYRHRTRVVAADGFAAGTLQLPPGKAHVDEFFGPVETYRGQLSAQLPGRAGNDSNRVSLEVHYQGCADIGVCYPPMTRTLVFGDLQDISSAQPPAPAEKDDAESRTLRGCVD